MTPPTSDNVADFIKQALDRFDLCAEAESVIRKDSLDDVGFRVGKQWPEDILAQRNLDGRPALVMNHLPQFLRQISNQYRQQRPASIVNPVGSGSDQDTADIFQGIIRHIEVRSDAEVADDHAFECMLTGGFGYTRLTTEYADDESFDQEICIKRIANQFSVYFDPNASEPDYSDAMYCFITEDMPIASYKDAFPESAMASQYKLSSIGDLTPGWATKDTIRVAEYFTVEMESRKTYLLADGTQVQELPEGQGAVQSREFVKRKVKWHKINAIEILDKADWPGKYIPVIPVLGEEVIVDGKRYLAGVIRNAKDPQRMYNYWCTAATETIALAPRAPFIIAEGQIENHEKEWATANVRSHSVLQYKPTSIAGTSVPPPQRNQFEPPIASMSHMIAQADNDLKAAIGIYDASLGKQGPESSGKAIEARKVQAEISTLNFSDNAARALRYRGRMLVDLIPKIYDAPRVMRILQPDGQAKHVGVYNSQAPNAPEEEPQLIGANGEALEKIYDLGVGTYDVTVSVGPSFQTKRQEAAATQLELMKSLPNQAPFFADIAVRNMDIPESKELSDRLRKMLPPQLQDTDKNDPEAQALQLQAHLNQMTQQQQQLVQQLNALTQELQTKQAEQQAKIRVAQIDSMTKENIVKLQEATKLAVAQINASKDTNESIAQREMDQYSILHDSAHEAGMAAMQHAQAKELADKQAQNALAAQAQQATNQPVEANP